MNVTDFAEQNGDSYKLAIKEDEFSKFITVFCLGTAQFPFQLIISDKNTHNGSIALYHNHRVWLVRHNRICQ